MISLIISILSDLFTITIHFYLELLWYKIILKSSVHFRRNVIYSLTGIGVKFRPEYTPQFRRKMHYLWTELDIKINLFFNL